MRRNLIVAGLVLVVAASWLAFVVESSPSPKFECNNQQALFARATRACASGELRCLVTPSDISIAMRTQIEHPECF